MTMSRVGLLTRDREQLQTLQSYTDSDAVSTQIVSDYLAGTLTEVNLLVIEDSK